MWVSHGEEHRSSPDGVITTDVEKAKHMPGDEPSSGWGEEDALACGVGRRPLLRRSFALRADGQIVDCVVRAGISDNTLIVFSSDNAALDHGVANARGGLQRPVPRHVL
jgi:hypothetical protein